MSPSRPASARPIAVVAGYLVRNPLGGHVLSILHWLVGLQDLGFEVVFVEHFGWSPSCYDPIRQELTDDPSYGIERLKREFARAGLERWCFVDSTGRFHGLTQAELRDACRASRVMVSLWQTTWVDEFRECRTRVFVDLDPGFTQFPMSDDPQPSASGYASPWDFDFHFSYGTRIGQPDCAIPTRGFRWRPIRPPIVLRLITQRFTPGSARYTTVMTWSNRKPIVHDGKVYGQKDIEFRKIAALPSVVGDVFEVALSGPRAAWDELLASGWRVIDGHHVSRSVGSYQAYIGASRGEFSVAVNLEVKSRSGWFSDRTAAYLATGKPVVVQDTGFSESLPCGEGLFAFEAVTDAAEAIATIEVDYARQCRAARGVAEGYFAADRILSEILAQIGVELPSSLHSRGGPPRAVPTTRAVAH